MKKVLIGCLMFMMLFGGCRAKQSYKSFEGKKKLRYYNSIQHQ